MKREVLVYEDDDGNTWEEEEDEDVTDKPSFEINLDDQKMVSLFILYSYDYAGLI